jgi:hypothetical protein
MPFLKSVFLPASLLYLPVGDRALNCCHERHRQQPDLGPLRVRHKEDRGRATITRFALAIDKHSGEMHGSGARSCAEGARPPRQEIGSSLGGSPLHQEATASMLLTKRARDNLAYIQPRSGPADVQGAKKNHRGCLLAPEYPGACCVHRWRRAGASSALGRGRSFF